MNVWIFQIGSTVMGAYSTRALAEMEKRRYRVGFVIATTLDMPA